MGVVKDLGEWCHHSSQCYHRLDRPLPVPAVAVGWRSAPPGHWGLITRGSRLFRWGVRIIVIVTTLSIIFIFITFILNSGRERERSLLRLFISRIRLVTSTVLSGVLKVYTTIAIWEYYYKQYYYVLTGLFHPKWTATIHWVHHVKCHSYSPVLWHTLYMCGFPNVGNITGWL